MATRTRPVDHASDRARTTLLTIGREIRDARMDRGLSAATVAAAVGLSQSQVSRIERGISPRVSIWHLMRLAAVVGLDVSVRAYPSGRPLRDSAHIELARRFRAVLHPAIRWQSEVPMPIAGDMRAWDAVIRGPDWVYGVEFETGPRDAQALVRRIELKIRDSHVDGAILVLPPTRRTHELLGTAGDVLVPVFPIDSRRARAQLTAGFDPGGSAVVVAWAARRRASDASTG
ncbi:MAG TPA: helix-turn-helix transcriptional regulator [Candidatus Binatia bacterium]|nr:helix-turn-helix transcriptional regulator [Candidatus Binatia bacterium]